jgi:glutaminyl-tRNA synthetase
MASGNINLRDPVMYRIIHEPPHHRTGDKWCIYPMYDFAHGQCDSIEGITHSLCSLEYEDHRPLYEWFLQELEIFAPRQIEFARLNMNYTVMSKRKLLRLVQEGVVRGWDDPRMPTRRPAPPWLHARIDRDFAGRIGVAKTDSVGTCAAGTCLREDLNKRAPRRMGVLRPLKLVIDNFPDDRVEEMDVVNNPEDPGAGARKVPFSKVLYIEQEDFQEAPPPKYYRLFPGNEVRLRYATSSSARARSRVRVKSSKCTLPMIRPREAATRQTAARSNRRALGLRSARHQRRCVTNTIACSAAPIPKPAKTSRRTSTPFADRAR